MERAGRAVAAEVMPVPGRYHGGDGTAGPRCRGTLRHRDLHCRRAGDYPWFGFRTFGGFSNSAPSLSSYHSTLSIVLGHSSP